MMMLGWLFPPASERRLLPERRGRPTLYVLAIMTFVAVIVAAAGLGIANAARIVGDGVANRYSVQIADGARWQGKALDALRKAPGVVRAQAVPERELRATLEEWLGEAGAQSAGLPLPALIDVDLAPGADVAAVQARVQSAVPGARLLAYAESLAPLARALRSLQWLALGLVLLMGLATAAAVILAARGALDTNRSTIEVMHGIGATDEQVTKLFQRRIALDALAGGALGAAAALLVLLLVLGGSTSLVAELAGGTVLRGRDWVLLALLPLAAAVLATVVARTAVTRALRTAL
jgi:cell division transport system permease protein